MIDSLPENIVYFYAEYQDAFGEIQTLVPQIKFEQGLSDNILDSINPETRNLFIVHVLLVTLVCKNKYRAPSRCIHDPTFRHSSLVSSSGVI